MNTIPDPGRILELINTVDFKVAKVKAGAPSTCTFSALKNALHFEPRALVRIKFRDLFDIDADILAKKKGTEASQKAVDRLSCVLGSGVEESLAHGLIREPEEGGQLWHTASHVLHPLTHSCVLSKDCQGKKVIHLSAAHGGNFEYGFTGIGSEAVWHGNPDALCNLPVLAVRLRKEQDSESSDGARSMIEAKVRFKDDDLNTLHASLFYRDM